MKSNTLFTKLVALLVCMLMVVTCLPVAAFAANDWEGEIDTADPIPGSEEAPIRLGALENTLVVADGETMYYYGNFNGMIMSVSGPDYVITVGDETFTPNEDGLLTMDVVTPSPREPFTFAITNNGAVENEYYVNFNYPEGTQNNPKDLMEGENTVTLEAGNMGYFFDFVAYSNGYVTFEISGEAGWIWQIDNLTTGAYGDIHTSADEDNVWQQTFKYTAEDNYVMMVNTFNPEDSWNAPAGDITVNVKFVPGWGTEDSPIILQGMENYVNIPAGETRYYQGHFSNMIMSVSGNEGFVVNYNGEEFADEYGAIEPMVVSSANPRMPVQFSITNNSAEEASYYIGFSYPEGSMNNPQDLWDGDNKHTFAEGDGAYYFDYVGYSNGYLTITVEGDCGWQYVINNVTAGTYGDIHFSDDETVVNSQTFEYTAGDEYVIEIATYNPADMWAPPAGTLNVKVEFVAGFGTEEDPFIMNDTNAVANIAAGETAYYQGYFAGMELSISGSDFAVIYNGETLNPVDGVVTISIPEVMGRPMPNVFGIVNNGDADAEFVISANYPAGTMFNPVVAILGDNAANIAAGTQGYFMTYTAEKAGDLIVTISGADQWTYQINNLTSFQYGDTQWSDSDPVVNPATIKVAAGDEIQIIVNGYDSANPWEAPAANLNVNLAYYVEPVVLPDGYATLKFQTASLKLEADMTVTFVVRGQVFAAGAYENPRVEYSIPDVLNGTTRTAVVTEYTTNSQGSLQFPFSGISPRMMKAPITATVYGTYQGVEYSYSMQYAVTTYCYNQLKKEANHSNTKFMTLLADLLNFGTAHQVYAKHDTSNLINADMTDFHKGFASTYALELEDLQNTKYEVIENPTAKFNSASLALQNAVLIRLEMTCADLTGVTLKVVADGVETIIPAEDWKYDDVKQRHYYDFDKLMAKQMGTAIYATICRDGVAISNTLQYSIETFVAKTIDKSTSSAELKNLLKMMMYYGNSAAAYFTK